MVQCEKQEPCLFKAVYKAAFQWTVAPSEATLASV
jgi:hypothetical protein